MKQYTFQRIGLALCSIFLFTGVAMASKKPPTPPLVTPVITQAINPNAYSTMQNDVPGSVADSLDQGLVDDSTPLNGMMLLLQRQAASEQALEAFMAQQTDPNSSNYHNWLTVEQIAEFGPAQSDINTIVGWLQDEGFTVDGVAGDGMTIEFSGTAGQVSAAFKTQVHNLNFNGVQHISNTTVPQIPSALAPAVQGVVSINDFGPHTNYKIKPQYTDPNNAGLYQLVPADMQTIYNVTPLYNAGVDGTGQTITLIEDTDVFAASDITTFRSTFGLPANTFTTVHPTTGGTCTDPGDVSGNDGEAELDLEWSGAAAPGATLVLASCKDSGATFGGLTAMQHLNSANDASMLWSISYGECEATNGATANASYVSVYQTAAARGVSVFVSSGDEGAASCDANAVYATHGIAVSGFASTPYNVAVGGTDFGDTYAGDNSTYWNSTNGTYYGSALSYINEIPWNDSCASQLLATYYFNNPPSGFTSYGNGTTYGPSGFCNSTLGEYESGGQYYFLTTGSGSGGPSNCYTGTAATQSGSGGSCAGQAKPSWQTGVVGIPADGVRDLPDVSLFASNGSWDHYYIYCYTGSATYGGTACTAGDPGAWSGAGGTSFSSPIMAGFQALVNQQTGSSQGNPNPTYYSLAATEYGTSGTTGCNSTLGNAVDPSCIFYDVTQGDLDVNCRSKKVGGTTYTYNCYLDGATNGVLSTSNSAYQPAYTTTTGWDFATGIGTVNACNLVNNWTGTPGSLACGGTPTTYTVTPSAGANGTISPSTPQTVNSGATTTFTVTPSTGYTASVGGTCGGTLSGTTYTTNAVTANCTVIASFTINTYTVTPSVSGINGTISPSTPQTVNYNTTTSFTVTPSAGYTASVGGTCGGTLSGTTYTTNAVTANCTVIASFTINTYTVTPSVSGSNGTISPSTPQTVNYNTTTSFTVTPSAGYTASVGGTCGGTLSGTTYTTNAVTANCTVIASFTINTYTVTPSVSGSNGTISPSTPQTVNYNTTTSFTVTPSAGYTASVGGTCGGTLSGTTYTTNAVTANCTVIASFAINTYTVTPSAGANGTISPSTPQTVASGATTSFTVTPNAGYTASVGGTCGGTLSGTTYTTNAVTANCTVVASFAINTYTVTPSAGANGTISPSTPQTVNYNTTTSFTVTPSTGYTASVGGTCGGTLSGTTYTTNAVTANCTVIASFAINTYTVTPSAGANGTISPSTPQTVNYNTTTSFTVTPSAGYTASVGGTCGGTLSGTTYTTNAVTANCTVIASFAINTYTVTPSVTGSGTISPSTPQTVNYNTTASFTLTPNAGNVIGSVTGTCGGTLTGSTYTTTAVTANCTVIANFVPTYTIGGAISGLTGSVGLTLTGTNPTSSQTRTFSANGGFTFPTALQSGSGWAVNVSTQPAGQTCSIAGGSGTNLLSNVTSVIVTCAANTFTVTSSVNGSNGTISPSGAQTVNYNTQATFTVTPSTGYTASVGGTCGGTLVGTTYTTSAVTANCTVIASFTINTYTVTPSVSGSNGTITPTTQQIVNYGATPSFTVTPNAGYVASVGGSCGGTLSGTTYTTNPVSANCTVIASFALNTYTLTYTAGANGSISGTSPQTVSMGANGTPVTAVPNTGYYFVQWSDGSTANPRTDMDVTASISVTATFAPDVLVFTTQPANVVQGTALGTVVVTEEDGNGNVIGDSSSTVDFTITTACGTVDLGSVTMVNGVATLTSSQLFYTVTSGGALSINASITSGATAIAAATSSSFDVTANGDLIFADGFENCRL